jgi:hypothetical protein
MAGIAREQGNVVTVGRSHHRTSSGAAATRTESPIAEFESLAMIFFKSPAWYQALPPHLRPPKNKLKRLDEFRRSLEVDDDDVFMVMIGGTKWAVIKAQELLVINCDTTSHTIQRRNCGGLLFLQGSAPK